MPSLPPADATGSTADVVAPAPERPALERGTCVDRYIVADLLGRGGMGVVYKAFDPQLGRQIALKLLRADDDAAGTHRERLLREAQALARLSHPSVIAVHDVGTFGDEVFIAMELVEGPTLREWTETPRAQRQILEVFIAAGEGLKAAHAAGLVHRDFKPENVIVANDGRVRVLDFGLARVATNEPSSPPPAEAAAAAAAGASRSPQELTGSSSLLTSHLTRSGSVLGTPRYMAPEQHLGQQVDERADQFSFCVSLYVALHAQFPFAGTNLLEFKDNVVNGRVLEPPAGSRVPRWLQKVLLRGMAVAPQDRHPSMAALLQALRADPREARRRWLPAATVLLALVGLAVSWRVARRNQVRACASAEDRLMGLWDDARRSAVRAAFRTSGVPYAEAALRSAEETLDRYARGWVQMRVDTCEATQVRHEQSQELLDLRMSCLDDRLIQLKTLTDLFATADARLVERAVRSAQSLPGLDLCADTVALRAPVPPPRDPKTRQRVDEARQQLARASALELAARYDEGLAITRAVLSESQALHYRPVEAEAELRLGELYGDHGDYAESAHAYHRALVAAEAGHHDQGAARAATALIQAVGIRLARYQEGDDWAELAEALIERLHSNDELLGAFYTKRSLLLDKQSRYDEALRDGQRALELERRVFGENHYSLTETYAALAHTYHASARYNEALDAYAHALAIEQRTLGPEHPQVVDTLIGMATVHAEIGQHERAFAEFDRALSTIKRVQADHPLVAKIHHNLGYLLGGLGRPRDALTHFALALDYYQKKLGPSHEVTTTLKNMGQASLDLGQPEEALRYYKQAIAVCERVLGPGNGLCGAIDGDMGESYRQLGRLDEAMVHFQRSVSLLERAQGPKHPDLMEPLLGIARVKLARQAFAAAKVPLERALAINETQTGDRLSLANVQFALAQALWATDEPARARNLATQARDTYGNSGALAQRQLAEATEWLREHR